MSPEAQLPYRADPPAMLSACTGTAPLSQLLPSSRADVGQTLREQLALAAESGWRLMLPALALTLVVGALAWGRAPALVVVGWVLLEAAVIGWRSVLAWRLRGARAPSLATQRLNVALLVSAAISGSLVGLSGPLFAGATGDPVSMLLVLAVAVWIAGAAVALGAYPLQYYLFVGTAVPIAAAPWLLAGTLTAGLLAALLVVCGLGLALHVAVLGRAIGRAVRIREEADREVQRAQEAERRADEAAAVAMHAAEQARGAARAAREAAQARARFLVSASHDLKQPLTALSLLLDQLGERPLDAGAGNLVGHASAAVRSGATLVAQLHALARFDEGAEQQRPRCFALPSLLDPLAAEHGARAQAKGLSLQFESADVRLYSDPELLGLALANLVDNAIGFTPAGQVSVRFALVPVDDGEPPRPTLTVEDTGVGMPPAMQARLLDAAFPVDHHQRDRSRGLGVGLLIVRRIAALLGAELRLASEPGRGTRVSLALPEHCFVPSPADGAEPASPEVDETATLADEPACARVLVVEDDVAVAEALELLLQTWGHDVVSVADGEEAMVRLEQERFDVLISDYRLPGGVDGLEVCAQARRRHAGTARLLISGDTDATGSPVAVDDDVRLLTKPLSAAAVRGEFARLGLSRRSRQMA